MNNIRPISMIEFVFNKAADLIKESRFDDAIDFLTAENNKPAFKNHPYILLNFSSAYFFKKNYEKSLFYLNKILKKFPDDIVVLNNIAQCYCLLKKFDLSIKYLKKTFDILTDKSSLSLIKTMNIEKKDGYINVCDSSYSVIDVLDGLINIFCQQYSFNYISNTLIPFTHENENDGSFLVYNDDANVYGYGLTLFDAFEDFFTCLIEMFDVLIEDKNKLAPNLLKQYNYISKFLQKQ